MSHTSRFEEHVQQRVAAAIASVQPDEARETYVISLCHHDDEGSDARYPMVLVGNNTETRVAACMPAPDEPVSHPIAPNAFEARWNFAYFQQNQLAYIGESDDDPSGVELRREWIEKDLQAWYEEGYDDSSAGLISHEFLELLVRVVQRLHATGVIREKFDRPVPVLIHALEYDREMLERNLRANPPEAIREFAVGLQL